MTTTTTPPDQTAYWNGPAAERWVREQIALDAMLAPYSIAALDEARVAPGERVLDVGCGCGGTSFALADRVGPGGAVVGLDVSRPMLSRAQERRGDRANVTFVLGDAASEPIARRAFDLLFSRFGVMFFADPTAAFRHLRGALRPDGRLTFVCWQAVTRNPWASLPFNAVSAVLGRPEPAGPEAPGPFSFGDDARVRRILGAAGFADVALRPFAAKNGFGSGSDDEVAAEISRVGPVARMLVDKDEATVRRAIEAMRDLVKQHREASGEVRFDAAAWIVTARSPG